MFLPLCSLVIQIGDETFIIAALMAMRHPKTIVLSGALAALVVMTVRSLMNVLGLPFLAIENDGTGMKVLG